MGSGTSTQRRLLIAIDAKGYGARDTRDQFATQEAINQLLAHAADRAHLRRDTWQRQEAGDGEVAVLPDAESECAVVDDFVRELADALADHNHGRREHSRIRLRMAVHHGVAIPASKGYAGQGVVVVSRVVDSPILRQTLDAVSAADLVIALTNRVFEDTVAQRLCSLRADQFRRVMVWNKEHEDAAWFYIPGHDVHSVNLTEAPPSPSPPATASRPATEEPSHRSEAAGQSVHTTIHGDVKSNVIGIVNGPANG